MWRAKEEDKRESKVNMNKEEYVDITLNNLTTSVCPGGKPCLLSTRRALCFRTEHVERKIKREEEREEERGAVVVIYRGWSALMDYVVPHLTKTDDVSSER